jgi:AcrR family transcriptional regulator
MPKVSEEHQIARREQILDAALNCFASNGYHKTSMRDIFKEAGLSTGAVYLHFRSKEEIMEAVFKRNQEARKIRVEKAQKAQFPRDGLRQLSGYFLGKLAEPVADKTWQLWVQLISEGIRNPLVKQNILEGWDLMEKQYVDFYSQAVERGEINDALDPKAIARLWIVIHDGLILQKIMDPEQDVRMYAEVFNTLVDNARQASSNNYKKEERQ